MHDFRKYVRKIYNSWVFSVYNNRNCEKKSEKLQSFNQEEFKIITWLVSKEFSRFNKWKLHFAVPSVELKAQKRILFFYELMSNYFETRSPKYLTTYQNCN